MFGGDIYTLHEKAAIAEPTERVVLVREGFSFWAFVFTILWLLAHRCWRMSLVYLLLVALLHYAGDALHLTVAAQALTQLGLQFWLGCVANDCRRAALARSGYREAGVVCAESRLLAERRYFDQLHTAA